jgi:hypothetical protein
MVSTNEYLVQLHGLVDDIKRRSESSIYANASREQETILLHFLNRTAQVAQACFLTGGEGLGTPLYVMMRVLCEDLFLSFWVATSTANADDYRDQALSELARMAVVNLEKGQAKLVTVSTGKDQIKAVTSEIRHEFVKPRTNIEQIAKQVGLEKVYDSVYRFASSEVHAKTFTSDRPIAVDEEGIKAALPAIIALARSVMLIVDNCLVSKRTTTKQEVLGILNI